MSNPDLYSNRMGKVLVISPAKDGRLGPLAEERKLVFNRQTGDVEKGTVRWIFSDVPRATLEDQWGNRYDHQVHSLLAGTLAQGEAFLAELEAAGFDVSEADHLFVPLQKLDPSNRDSSDQLRTLHPRAFVLACRMRPSVRELITAARDSGMLGE